MPKCSARATTYLIKVDDLFDVARLGIPDYRQGTVPISKDKCEMPKLNLKGMSVADLVALRDMVQEELSRKIDAERSALEKQIVALAELKAGKSPRRAGAEPAPRRQNKAKADGPKTANRRSAKRLAAARYAGPNGETWSGFGRAPRWLTELEADGKSRESFLVAE